MALYEYREVNFDETWNSDIQYTTKNTLYVKMNISSVKMKEGVQTLSVVKYFILSIYSVY
jgi:hypothetical protein